MARNWKEKARIDYETTSLTLKEIAQKYNKSQSIVRQWSAKEKWLKNCTAIEQEIEQAAQKIIKSTIEQKQAEIVQIADKIILTQEKILEDIENIKQKCMQGEPVYDKEGNATGEWKFDARAALKACELQGKHLGIFEKDNKQKATQVVSMGSIVIGGNTLNLKVGKEISKD